MPRTHQIVYISYARRPMSDEELIDLCHRSAEKNKKDGITGFLTFDGKAFLHNDKTSKKLGCQMMLIICDPLTKS